MMEDIADYFTTYAIYQQMFYKVLFYYMHKQTDCIYTHTYNAYIYAKYLEMNVL